MESTSLDNMLKSVLGVGNAEQNQSYPPNIYSSHFNVVTSLLINKLVDIYPINLDMLKPFMVKKQVIVTNGYVELTDDYRNLLGAGISAKNDNTGECDTTPTGNDFNVGILKAGCTTRPIEFLTTKEWDYRTTSGYKFPTYWNPIGCFFESNKFKVCPYDLKSVEIRYVRKEAIVSYGYIMQPDDTFIFDPSNSVESELTSAAFAPLFNALSHLYAAYTRDPDLTNYAMILTEKGIL